MRGYEQRCFQGYARPYAYLPHHSKMSEQCGRTWKPIRMPMYRWTGLFFHHRDLPRDTVQYGSVKCKKRIGDWEAHLL